MARIARADQLVRLAYPLRVPLIEGSTFELKVLAPLAAFVLNPGGGDISFVVGLPRIPGRNITIVETAVENPPGTSIAAFGQPETVLAERKFAAHYLKQDPVYRLRYQYTSGVLERRGANQWESGSVASSATSQPTTSSPS